MTRVYEISVSNEGREYAYAVAVSRDSMTIADVIQSASLHRMFRNASDAKHAVCVGIDLRNPSIMAKYPRVYHLNDEEWENSAFLVRKPNTYRITVQKNVTLEVLVEAPDYNTAVSRATEQADRTSLDNWDVRDSFVESDEIVDNGEVVEGVSGYNKSFTMPDGNDVYLWYNVSDNGEEYYEVYTYDEEYLGSIKYSNNDDILYSEIGALIYSVDTDTVRRIDVPEVPEVPDGEVFLEGISAN